MPALIVNLEAADRRQVAQVGGKAASLGELLRAAVPVPPGFVLTTAAFHQGLTPAVERELLAAFDRLGAGRVAVRSSAVAEDSQAASWAGQLESYLNVTRAGLTSAVQRCWESISSGRAQHYAREHGAGPGQQAVAVVVQAMVASDLAGVMFTANPVTRHRDELVIEAVYGLGELLVQGAVTPESLVVSKSGALLSRQPSRQTTQLVYRGGANRTVPVTPAATVVPSPLLKQLVAVGQKIERHYGTPQDIEWAVEDNRLYVVQSRPITTLS